MECATVLRTVARQIAVEKLAITGNGPLKGEVRISGAKNAALPLMIASLLTKDPLILENMPRLADVKQLERILENHGVDIVGIEHIDGVEQGFSFFDGGGFGAGKAHGAQTEAKGGDFDIYMGRWGYGSPDVLNFFFPSDAANNRSKINDPQLDAMLEGCAPVQGQAHRRRRGRP